MSDGKGDAIRIRNRETLSENWYKLEKVTFDQIGRDGSRQTLAREVYHNGPGAAVLPIDPARGTVLLVRQLRIPAHLNGDNPMLVEACAGMVEPGDSPAETVRKEAEQEMGYRLRGVRKVFELYMSPGASAEKLHLFVAEYGPGDRVGTGGGVPGEGGADRTAGAAACPCLGDGQGRRDQRREDGAAVAARTPGWGRAVGRIWCACASG